MSYSGIFWIHKHHDPCWEADAKKTSFSQLPEHRNIHSTLMNSESCWQQILSGNSSQRLYKGITYRNRSVAYSSHSQYRAAQNLGKSEEKKGIEHLTIFFLNWELSVVCIIEKHETCWFSASSPYQFLPPDMNMTISLSLLSLFHLSLSIVHSYLPRYYL